MPDEVRGAGAPQGLSWSWDLDFEALARCAGDGSPDGGAAYGGSSDGSSADGGSPDDSSVDGGAADSGSSDGGAVDGGSVDGGSVDGGSSGGGAAGGGADVLADEEAAQQAVLAAVEEHGGERIPAGALAGQIAEYLPPGPDLAAWLAITPAADLRDHDLAATAGSWRRVASWAQAQELAAVAQIVSRAAARDEDIETGADGRPARVPAAAAAEVSLELTMSQFAASWWSDLAVDLAWRLAATWAALAAGVIDLHRARLIAEATRMLSDAAAHAVEEKVLPAAGGMTTGALRAALRRAVITADPHGAEERRKETERQAKVSLYPDEENTVTLAGQRLPVIHATAAMARIKAMARAMKASGSGGGLDLLCAQVYLGLLLGTQPLIPPAEGAPPGPPDDDGPGYEPPNGRPDDNGPGNGQPSGPSADDGPGGAVPPPSGPPDDNGPGNGQSSRSPGRHDVPPPVVDAPDDAVPPPGDADAPRDDDFPCPDDGLAGSDWDGSGQDDDDDARPAEDWPDVPAALPAAFIRPGDGPPAGGMLDVSMPWQTLAGISPEPGYLGRVGPVTAIHARRLAELASRNPAAEWRIIVTTSGGQAIAVTRIPRLRDRDGPAGLVAGTGLVSRVTLTIPEDVLAQPPPRWPGPDPPGGILARSLQAAARAADRARAGAEADAAAGGCAHCGASSAYRPPPRLKEYIAARDLTCRFPTCRQPAWRGDLDHTIPHDKGGLTCRCNLGGLCRTHHRIKQHLGWSLHQTAPGIFRWRTRAGRIFSATPDIHPV
jgi:hypothetical protein